MYVDTDIALTVNADSIIKYFNHLDNFPLINSHTHDRIVVKNLIEGEEWSSPLNNHHRRNSRHNCYTTQVLLSPTRRIGR